ncbi:MAG: 2-oxo acid dehydrogenase subunit E2 [Clostridia bacterium]|nr:2-oxo acid dehydrogenase subunit E2 [Clostridia bacterium]
MAKEGRKIKTLPPMNVVSTYFMPNRNGASNQFSTRIDITETEKYIQEKRREGLPGLGIMHVLLAAYVQTVAAYPGINRFIRGQRIFARNNIEMCLTIKKEMALDAQETVLKIPANADATLENIYTTMAGMIEENRCEGDGNGMDSAARILTFLPSIMLKFTVWFLKVLDYFGLLPRFITKLSPFHSSMFITNLGSLGIPPIFHHLYDFGNIPLFISMGMKRTEYVTKKDGSTEKRKFVDVTIVCDERICDGHYYATAFKKLKRLAENAWLLENPPEKVNADIR